MASPSVPPTRHAGLVILLHWLTLLLIAAGTALAWIADDIEDRGLRRLLIENHRAIGLTVLALTLLRLLAALAMRRPAPVEGPALSRIGARVTHLALYGLLIAAPVAGWWLTSAAGKPASWFGLLVLPALADRDRDLADTLHDWHEVLTEALLVLIALHALAALWHHAVRRDGTLHRMLPARFTAHRGERP